MEDFINSYVLIIVLLLIAAITSFLFIVIMRWIIGPFIYSTLIALVALLTFASYYSINKYIILNSNDTTNTLNKTSITTTTTFTFTTDVSYYFSLSITWLIIGIITVIVLFIVLLIILVLIKRIRLAIQLIKEGSKAITGVFLTILFPLIPLLLELAFLAYFILTAVYLACAGSSLYRIAGNNTSNLSNSSTSTTTTTSLSCNPNQNISSSGVQCLFYRYGVDANSYLDSALIFLNDYQWLPQLFNVFMMFWTEAFLMGLNQMILAGCFGIWYWSQNRSHCILFVSIKDTFVYHLGSIAFGALLIAIVKTIRFVIQFIERRVKSAAGNNKVTKCIITFVSCCCQCCFWCMEKFLKFVNRNAYIMVAIYGRNFCTSAVDALTLLATNPLRALVLDRVTDFVLFIGRLLITAGVGVLGFYFFSKQFYISPEYAKYFAPDLHYYWLPLLAVILGSYFIAKTFLTVYEMAVDTVFLCALKDLSIHDGTPEKPYFMSTKLRKILAGSNKSIPTT
jgi:solute carrier family 44 (choline transporter-like protein), member 2/4/5